MSRKTNVWRGFTTITASLLALSVGVATVCESWKESLDQNLGTTSSSIETSDKTASDTYTYTSDYTTTDELVQAHEELNEQLSEEGSVLLKNNGTLPLGSGDKVTLFGAASHYPYYGPEFGGSVDEENAVSLEQALTDGGFEVNPTMTALYETLGNITDGKDEQGNDIYPYRPGALTSTFIGPVPGQYAVGEPPLSAYEENAAGYQDSFAEYSDAAIVVLGRSASEAADYLPGDDGLAEGESGENALALNDEERAMIDLACQNFDKVVVLINSVNQLELGDLADNDQIDAILWVGLPGVYGFNGVADVLNGEESPSGHLTSTYAANSQSSPAMVNFGNFEYTNKGDQMESMYLVEAEGIYSGYKYYETRYADIVSGQGNADSATGSSDGGAWNYEDEIVYGFGEGLSYTTFEQRLDSVETDEENHTMTVTATVTNTGDVAGKDVVQVYAQSPYTDYDRQNNVEKAGVQLMDYVKTDELQPGESQTVSTTFELKYLASYDYTTAKTYIMDAGDYYLSIGNGAHEALNNILAAQGYDVSDGMTDAGDGSLTYTWHQDEFDDTTYATSENGTEITNQLDDMDLNYWQEGTVTYLSRSDWEGTWPKAYTDIAITDEMQPYMQSDFYEMKTDEDTSDIFPEEESSVSFLEMKGADLDDERWDEIMDGVTLEDALYGIRVGGTQPKKYESVDEIVNALESDGPGGINGTDLATRSTDPDSPTYVSEDDPNATYKPNDYVCEPIVASTFNKDLATAQGALFGNDSLWTNTTIFFAPGVNNQRTPYNGRNDEYYSEDPMVTNYCASAVVAAAREKGTIIVPKHLAFNDQESGRMGISVFMNEQKARETELRGFEGMVDAGMNGLMTSMNRVGITYSSGHVGLMQNILRGEWGYQGFLMTDIIFSMKDVTDYMSAKESVIGGTTLMGISSDSQIGSSGSWQYMTVEGVSEDRQFVQALRDNTKYLFYALANSNAMNGLNSTSRVVTNMTWWRWSYAAFIVAALALTVLSLTMYARAMRKSGKEIER
ncbi:glycoside hydrolase family 3 protein [Bifidobacterium eulemuris]|uniref:Beta-glucosidase-related glycosidase n=1 Tax=Bifidobacterium eulemuris TaxID=1765219 RepID=A0A261FYJ2_9BIFI|nr:glycoside hydrolase family 3 protein [Bifidobacterium eulemuris]OZG64254.1 beta-glucosidase-related glycosidase [Bifidobacterium eulemuris]QOL32819.1 glycoside hydrolase family 3 protein [Bifidobacterium eulemuris]